jgi:GNAT superfamily N-acetyltransferase
MSSFDLKPASEIPFVELADLLTRGFEGYFVPIHITEAVLLTMMRRDSIDLSASRVLIKGSKPIGVALIARRGWMSRLAAMGIISTERNSGAGTWAMEHLIEEARIRGDKELVLEVIEQNMAGVTLYKKVGFDTVRRLVGYKLEKPHVESNEELLEIDIQEIAKAITVHGVQDLPWQLSGVTIAQHTPPARAFQLNDAYCLLSNPEFEHVSILSVLVNAGSRGAGLSAELMRAVFSRFPNKTWVVPSIYPEEICEVFDQIGMKREELSQLQMSLML